MGLINKHTLKSTGIFSEFAPDFNKVFNVKRVLRDAVFEGKAVFLRQLYHMASFIKKLGGILRLKCPKCNQGNLFVSKAPYKKGMAQMHETCPVCGENFNREPGFYFGAAYVSYAVTVALWVALFVAMTVFDAIGLISFSFANDAILFIVLGILLLVITLPLVYRLSRSIWIHIFVKYDPEAIKN